MNEVRVKGMYKQLLRKYPNVPEYVMHDFYRSSDDQWFAKLNRLDWKLQVISVNPSDFSLDTQRNFEKRQFGAVNPDRVPRDEERMQVQKRELEGKPQGENEPVILIKRVNGYELFEGFHRTMNLLLRGKNDGPTETWDRVKIKAWVGSSRKKP